MQNFYISDCHFGHKNIIKLDKRPFQNIEEMEKVMIDKWNNKVTKEDNVYILGDFCWNKEDEWLRILNALNGNKILICGNHDIHLNKMSSKLKSKFLDIKDYKEIKDKDRIVVMCHYPILFYKSDYLADVYHLFGHVHTTIENDYVEKFRKDILKTDTRTKGKSKCQFYNVGAMMPYMNYEPCTLDEIIQNCLQNYTLNL